MGIKQNKHKRHFQTIAEQVIAVETAMHRISVTEASREIQRKYFDLYLADIRFKQGRQQSIC